jgi:hypothetical protein
MEVPGRSTYTPPVTESIEVKSEGIICQSGELPDYNQEPVQNW